MAGQERSRWSPATIRRAAVASLVCLAAGWGAGYFVSHEKRPEPKSAGPFAEWSRGAQSAVAEVARPGGPAELALVAPLSPGSSLEGYTLDRIEAVRGGLIVVVFVQEKKEIRLQIALASESAPQAPGIAGRFAVYYEVHGVAPREAETLSVALASVVARNSQAPIPAGMGPLGPLRSKAIPK